MSNHLENSISPYLLQHAQNPVDWYPWKTEALEIARFKDKPIFLSIGYSACHWCHVMAHETFEDPEIAEIMNNYFVNIKVDREERPDLDSIFMAYVVALNGQGGWPMSVFLTPDLTPFYGGTYFPPISRYGLPAFKDVLLSLSNIWHNRREEVISTSWKIALHQQVKSVNDTGSIPLESQILFIATQNLIKSYDQKFGGWGTAPKFPQPMALEFLIRRHLSGDGDALKPVVHTLKSMARGGMFDVVGGGFARYSTDNDWHIPHFEKMLYDNAQLIQVYLHAWLVTNDASFRQVMDDSLHFVTREMSSELGGFYSSLDADSEGEEGKFYLWTLKEIQNALGAKDDLYWAAFGLNEQNDKDNAIILQRKMDDSEIANLFGFSIDEVKSRMKQSRDTLLAIRNRRIHPALDDKVLTSWNGLMLSAFAEAARVFGNHQYLQIAIKNANFLLKSLRRDGILHRAWRNGRVSPEVFLEDYAALILGLLDLYQTDFDNRWYIEAYDLTEEMIRRFNDPKGGFFDIPNTAQVVLLKPKELQDNAIPSGNALAAEVLLKMAAYAENEEWRILAENMLGLVANIFSDYPTAFSRWLTAADFSFNEVRQVAIIGDLTDKCTRSFLKEIRKSYYPNMIVAASNFPVLKGSPKLLSNRSMVNGEPTVYICVGFICKEPVTKIDDLKAQLDKLKF